MKKWIVKFLIVNFFMSNFTLSVQASGSLPFWNNGNDLYIEKLPDDGVMLLSVLGKGVIIVEIFLEIFRKISKGIVREIAAHVLQKRSRKQENHPSPSQAGWFSR